MPAKKKKVRRQPKLATRTKNTSFAAFIDDPMIATALIVFALIALMLSILEFTNAIAK